MSIKVFYSHGKLLLTGEYLVLDGAKAIALPTTKGQYLTVKNTQTNTLRWKSFDADNSVWYEDEFELDNLKMHQTTNAVSRTLLDILLAAQKLNSSFLNTSTGVYVTTKLTFSRAYGLGSSSTLIANIAQWANVDPYQLLWTSFKGSGYDLACATSTSAIVYQLSDSLAKVTAAVFKPSFKDQLFFVYLNKKQNSKEGILHYRKVSSSKVEVAKNKVNAITTSLLKSDSLFEFELLLEQHESVISDVIQLPTIKSQLFNDYNGVVKSLGAWGGDFVLVTAKNQSDLKYFVEKGYTVLFSYNDMILS
ncbi:MAG: GYDIA family GHMP kinase [Flavobacteriaceae bacterium]